MGKDLTSVDFGREYLCESCVPWNYIKENWDTVILSDGEPTTILLQSSNKKVTDLKKLLEELSPLKGFREDLKILKNKLQDCDEQDLVKDLVDFDYF